MVTDYLDAYGLSPEPVRHVPRDQAQRGICAALGESGVAVFDQLQAGKLVPTTVPRRCVGALSMGRFVWEFSELSSGQLLVTRTARVGGPFNLTSMGNDVTTEEREGLVVTIVTDQMWDCPIDPEDPCASFPVDGTQSYEARCIADERTPCTKGKLASSVHVAEIGTKRSLMFGSFQYRSVPRVIVTQTQVTVVADDCTQTAKRPWAGKR